MTVISEVFRKGTIMQYTTPHYYKKFHCTGSDCPATCCAGWQIQIDPASLRKYRKVRGPLGNRLRNEIDWKEGCFRRYSGRCAFLNEKNLCDLYLEGGDDPAVAEALSLVLMVAMFICNNKKYGYFSRKVKADA